MMGDLVRIKTIVNTPIRDEEHPFLILDYFDLTYDRLSIKDSIWSHIEKIRQQVFTQMLQITGDEYRLDWSRLDSNLCLWYRSRDASMDAMRDLDFARKNSITTIQSTEVKNSLYHGLGLFATADFKKETHLTDIEGTWVDFKDYERIRNNLSHETGRLRDYFFMEWNYYKGSVLARNMRTSYGFINHSTTPNVEIRYIGGREDLKPRLALYACQDIREGDEIVIDYRKEDLPRGYLNNPGTQYLYDSERDVIGRQGG